MRLLSLVIILVLSLSSECLAWGAKGHQAVGAIADAKLTPHAKAMVQSLIGISLETAGPWLDCVKDVKGSPDSLQYVKDDAYAPGCSAFWNTADEAAIVAFATRNWDNCPTWSEWNPCHSQYHFADVDISTPGPVYRLGLAGTNEHDVVQTIGAAVAVLRDTAVPKFFKGRMTKSEALLALAHLVGDLHQPLHVGSIYLAADGHETVAASGDENDPGFTRGGNLISVSHSNLHTLWDTVSNGAVSNAQSYIGSASTPASTLPDTWAAEWATETIMVSKGELEALNFGAETPGKHWPLQFGAACDSSCYTNKIDDVQARQMAAAGVHLADLLNAIWP